MAGIRWTCAAFHCSAFARTFSASSYRCAREIFCVTGNRFYVSISQSVFFWTVRFRNGKFSKADTARDYPLFHLVD